MNFCVIDHVLPDRPSKGIILHLAQTFDEIENLITGYIRFGAYFPQPI